MENQCQHLIMTQLNELLKILQISEEFFDRTLGTWKTDTVDFKLKENANPICSRPYSMLKVHDIFFKKEVERLVILGVLNVENDSEWVSLSFVQHKPKSNKV